MRATGRTIILIVLIVLSLACLGILALTGVIRTPAAAPAKPASSCTDSFGGEDFALNNGESKDFTTDDGGKIIYTCMNGVMNKTVEAAQPQKLSDGETQPEVVDAVGTIVPQGAETCPPTRNGQPLNSSSYNAANNSRTCSYLAAPEEQSAASTEPDPAGTTDPTQPAVNPVDCKDGEFISDEADLQGLPRMPVTDGHRAVIVEVAHFGTDFPYGDGGLDRAIFVFPAGGNVWETNVTAGAATMAVRAFCGQPADVAQWAVTAHVPSLQQASRAPDGSQPPASEIGVYLVNYEEKTMTVVKAAPDGPAPADLLSWFDVSFHEGDKWANVPIQLK